MSSFPQNSWTEARVLAREQGPPVRVVVAEPDTVSRRLICSILEAESNVTLQCIDSSVLLSVIQETDPDLVILDMQTSAIRRAANWEALGVKSPPATIVTSYDASSLMPFASAAADLLIKPFNVEEFQDAIEAARLKIIRARSALSQIHAHNQEPLPEKRRWLQRLAAESDGSIVLVKVEDILWLQSFGNRIRVHSAAATHLLRYTMKSIQALLDPNRFLRVHRNAIVNLDHVVEFFLPTTGNMFVKLDNETCLPLRRASRASLRRHLRQHLLI
jgi:two-component system, LytTR family, response regulator